MYSEPRLLPCGDSALVVEFGDEIDEAVNRKVVRLDRRLSNQSIEGILELIPTYRSLMVQYDPFVTSLAVLKNRILAQLDFTDCVGESSIETNRIWSVPVVYGGEYGIDMEELAFERALTPAEVIDRHADAEYRVYMIGFMPGFSYLGGLDPRLASPRRKHPRAAAPKGTIAIGGAQTAVQSVVGPSGWHWIGRTPLEVYNPERKPMCLLEPGDVVRFYAVTADSWATEKERCEEMVREAAV